MADKGVRKYDAKKDPFLTNYSYGRPSGTFKSTTSRFTDPKPASDVGYYYSYVAPLPKTDPKSIRAACDANKGKGTSIFRSKSERFVAPKCFSPDTPAAKIAPPKDAQEKIKRAYDYPKMPTDIASKTTKGQTKGSAVFVSNTAKLRSSTVGSSSPGYEYVLPDSFGNTSDKLDYKAQPKKPVHHAAFKSKDARFKEVNTVSGSQTFNTFSFKYPTDISCNVEERCRR